MRALVGVGVAVVLALAGCAPAAGPPVYTTIGQLSAAYIDAGGSCSDLVEQYRASDTAPAVATCGDTTVLTMAASPDDAQALATGYRLRDVPVLVDGSWLIEDPEIDALQAQLGGQIVTLEPADGPANLADALILDASGVRSQPPVRADVAPTPAALDGTVITVVVDPSCAYCSTFLLANQEQLTTWAADGTATVVYRLAALGDTVDNGFAASSGVNALACVADRSPSAFVPALLALAEQSGEGWDAEKLAFVTEAAGADVEDCITGGTFAYWTRQATARALAGPLPDGEPLYGVPSVFVGDRIFAGDVSDAAAFAAFVAG